MWTPYKKITPSDQSVIGAYCLKHKAWGDLYPPHCENNPHTAQRARETTSPGMCVRACVNACEPRFMKCNAAVIQYYLPCIKPPSFRFRRASSLSFHPFSQTPCIHYDRPSLNRRKNDGLFRVQIESCVQDFLMRIHYILTALVKRRRACVCVWKVCYNLS